MLQKRPISTIPSADSTIACHVCGLPNQGITLCGGGSYLSIPRRLRVYPEGSGSAILESMLFHCPQCDARYLHPRPEERVLEQHYKNAKELHGTNTVPRYLARIHDTGNDDYLRDLFDWLRINFQISLPFLRSGLMVDVGCNAAGLLRAAMAQGIPCLGIEVDSELCDLNREHIACDVYNGMFESLPPTYDGKASILILRDSLEHHLHPTKSLAIAHRLLKSGGILFVDVPNFDCALAQHNIEAFDWFESDHMFYFSNRAITNAFQLAGFTAVATHTPVGEIDRTDAGLVGHQKSEIGRAYEDMLVTAKSGRKLWCAGLKP